jgi:PadR family transcriptional regulator PadR
MFEQHGLMKTSIDSLLLHVISLNPMYGYQIVKELESRSEGYFRFKEGTLYPALHRLETSGLISGYWEDIEGGRRRRYYKINQKGLATLEEKRDQWQDYMAAVNRVIQPTEA